MVSKVVGSFSKGVLKAVFENSEDGGITFGWKETSDKFQSNVRPWFIESGKRL